MMLRSSGQVRMNHTVPVPGTKYIVKSSPEFLRALQELNKERGLGYHLRSEVEARIRSRPLPLPLPLPLPPPLPLPFPR